MVYELLNWRKSMNKLCDLHTHSVFSDGTYTPSEIINEAISVGLSAVALTDHNAAYGLGEFISAAYGKNIDAVAGVEFSTDYDGKELHILGLFIKPEYFTQVTQLMLDVNKRKEQSNIQLIEALKRVGIILDYEEIRASALNGMVNRAHIAGEMMKKGYTSSVAEGFEKYLAPSKRFYKPPKRLTTLQIIDFIHSIGSVSVLAHPFLSLEENELLRFLSSGESCGLNGIECYYSTNDDATTVKSLHIAAEFGLMPSGGSDFHCDRKPDIKLGTGKGNLKIPFECYKQLKELI